jgi:hypothetical protein
MVDNVNPNTQFHPYQPVDKVPQTGMPMSPTGFGGILGKLGIDQSKIDALGGSLKNVNLSNVRTTAQKNPGLVLGGLAVLAIGAGLLRRRGTVR